MKNDYYQQVFQLGLKLALVLITASILALCGMDFTCAVIEVGKWVF